MSEELTPLLLRKLLIYYPDTGDLVWRHRCSVVHTDDRTRRAFNTQFAGKPALTAKTAQGYKNGSIFGKRYLAHRVIWAMMNGAWPKDQIDHIDGDRANNRLENLRGVSHQENSRNAKLRIDNTSNHTGVSWEKSRRKWEAYIQVNMRKISLGRFDEFDDAVEARKKAEIKYNFHENHGRN